MSAATNVDAGPATTSIGGAAVIVKGLASPVQDAVTLTVSPVGSAVPAATSACTVDWLIDPAHVDASPLEPGLVSVNELGPGVASDAV